MVSEGRLQQLDFLSRAKFTESGEKIRETRFIVQDSIYVEQTVKRETSRKVLASAAALNSSASEEMFDIG